MPNFDPFRKYASKNELKIDFQTSQKLAVNPSKSFRKRGFENFLTMLEPSENIGYGKRGFATFLHFKEEV